MKYLTLSKVLSISTLCVLFQSQSVLADSESTIESIEVLGVKQRLHQLGALKDGIAKTELLNEAQLKDKQAANLTEAIQTAIGIRVSNECSMCGAKRVMINGLKGEHTNVLVDGVPVHTMMSGFYGLDAVAMSGVGEIEIARGAGASLTAPEAIGGTLNLVTKSPTKNQLELDVAGGEHGYQKASLMLTGVNTKKDLTGSVIAQYDTRDQFDGDKNGVSETPFLDNRSITATGAYDVNYHTSVSLRLNYTESEVFGGPMLGDVTPSIEAALASESLGEAFPLFEGGDVNNQFIANPWQTAEWVATQREEAIVKLLHDFDGRFNIGLSVAYIDHEQDSYYEGIDYLADNTMHFVDLRANYELNDSHFLTFGGDIRDEKMRSYSRALVDNPNYESDSFDYSVKGIYLQDTWTPLAQFDASIALRIDNITADFVDESKPGTEIDETLISPRLDMRYRHNSDWQSRFSLGYGYRAPLSFFESDHGILDAEKGYLVDVSKAERSLSASYSLNFTVDKYISTLSFAHTQVDHLASLDYTDSGIPILTQLTDTASVSAIDWAFNVQLLTSLNLGVSAELYKYDDTFKESFGIAPIEKRAGLSGLWQREKWRINVDLRYVASRDLSEYGYFGFDRNDATDKKPTQAPSYVTVDLKTSYRINESLSFYFGATNLFDYNQAADESSPLFYDQDGGYDVTYIYAPMRGRTAYIGFDFDY